MSDNKTKLLTGCKLDDIAINSVSAEELAKLIKDVVGRCQHCVAWNGHFQQRLWTW